MKRVLKAFFFTFFAFFSLDFLQPESCSKVGVLTAIIAACFLR